jgi:hypothetical protein
MINFILIPNDPEGYKMHILANSKEEVLFLLKQDEYLYNLYTVDFYTAYVLEGIYKDYYFKIYPDRGSN